jgi:hypothetical protein
VGGDAVSFWNFRKRLWVAADPFCVPGEHVQEIFLAYVMKGSLQTLGRRIIAATNQRVLVLNVEWDLTTARDLRLMLDRHTLFEPPRGLTHQVINLGGPYHFLQLGNERLGVERDYCPDMERADFAVLCPEKYEALFGGERQYLWHGAWRRRDGGATPATVPW